LIAPATTVKLSAICASVIPLPTFDAGNVPDTSAVPKSTASVADPVPRYFPQARYAPSVSAAGSVALTRRPALSFERNT